MSKPSKNPRPWEVFSKYGIRWRTDHACGSVCCALCASYFGPRHTHPFQWKAEVQEFFRRYSDIPLHSCVCKADEVSLRRGYQGKFKGDFVPRWKKREQKKHKVVCCLPSVRDIYTACGVSSVSCSDDSSSEDSSVSLCEQHYQCVYKYLASDSLECALRGSLPKHSTGSKGRHVRSIPQPDTIKEILSEVGNFELFVSEDGNVCNTVLSILYTIS